jgi:molecular chaperone HtpG
MREEAADLFAAMQNVLDEHVEQVRLSNRLITSPACLVGTEMDYSPIVSRFWGNKSSEAMAHYSC